MNLRYIENFHKSRETRIGASEIAWCIPHPVNQFESLAAYTDPTTKKRHACTALDLYNEKINPTPWEYNFPADMGHYLEGKALYEFISDFISRDIATEFLKGYQAYKIENDEFMRANNNGECLNPEPFNTTPFKHNTEAAIDSGVAHGDCLYVPMTGDEMGSKIDKMMGVPNKHIIKKNGLTIDLSKPALIEAKSAQLLSVQSRKKDVFKGYDLTLKKWEGIPLKVYFQLQYQMWLYKVGVCYLTLIFNTSEKHYWQIKANKPHQRDLAQYASLMKQCIDNRRSPKELVMNAKDISSLYPDIKDDFREVSGEELTELLEVVDMRGKADTQEKAWKRKKEDAEQRMSIHLKDTGMIKGIVDGSLETIAKWKITKSSKRTMGLSEIGEREDSKKLLKYLEKNKLIKKTAESKKPAVVFKGGGE